MNLIALTISYQLALKYLYQPVYIGPSVGPPVYLQIKGMTLKRDLLRLLNHNKTLQELTIRGLDHGMSLELMDVLHKKRKLAEGHNLYKQ